MDETYRVSPAWAARTRFTGAEGDLRLEPVDLAILLRIAGSVADHTPGEVGDIEAFVEDLRGVRDMPDTESVPLSIGVRAIDVGMRLPQFLNAVERLRHARNRDSRCFASVTVTPDGKGASFTIAGGVAMITAHRCFASRLSWTTPGYRRGLPFSERAFVEVRPSAFGGFRSVSSVPVALRLMSWLYGRSAEGLPPDHRCEVDEHGRWLIRATQETIARTLGITTSRNTLGYYQDLFPRIGRDLERLGIKFRVVAEPVHRRATNWRIRFQRLDGVDRIEQWSSVPDDMDDGDEASAMLSRIVLAARSPDVDLTVEHDTPAPEPVVDPVEPEPMAPVVAEAPVPSRPRPRGRMTGIVIAEPETSKDTPEPVANVAPTPLPLPTEDHGLTPIAAPVIPPVPYVYDVRPWWLKRRFIHMHPMLPNIFADRAIGNHAQQEDAFREGVHIWVEGMGHRPARVQGLSLWEGTTAIIELRDEGWRRVEWVNFSLNCPGSPWEPDSDMYHPVPDDDHESELPLSFRTSPRPAASAPHDGLGYVDDHGNPVDAQGRPEDRTHLERAWADLVVDLTAPAS